MTVHNFNKSLRESHEHDGLALWEECFKKLFPDMQAFHFHSQPGYHQRDGIDVSIVFKDGTYLYIDVKVRKRNKHGRVYDDIALEYLSDKARKSPGWVVKPMRCDYILYAIAPLGIAYLLPLIQLQAAWRKFGEEWLANDKYKNIEALNERSGKKWTTVSVGVPANIVFAAIGNSHRVGFERTEI